MPKFKDLQSNDFFVRLSDAYKARHYIKTGCGISVYRKADLSTTPLDENRNALKWNLVEGQNIGSIVVDEDEHVIEVSTF